MGLTAALARERPIESQAVPDQLLGCAIVLVYGGLLASAAHEAP
jgi:hypothetical protein